MAATGTSPTNLSYTPTANACFVEGTFTANGVVDENGQGQNLHALEFVDGSVAAIATRAFGTFVNGTNTRRDGVIVPSGTVAQGPFNLAHYDTTLSGARITLLGQTPVDLTAMNAAGGYKFADFLKIGVPMNIVVGVATCAAIHFMV